MILVLFIFIPLGCLYLFVFVCSAHINVTIFFREFETSYHTSDVCVLLMLQLIDCDLWIHSYINENK
jgi:hypothetical protein